MAWMTENGHEFNPNRALIKNQIILSRASDILSDESLEYLQNTLEEASKKSLDRDLEISIALDVVELLSATGNSADAAQLGDLEIRREVELKRISPVDGVIVRDLINSFTPPLFVLDDYISDDSYLKSVKNANGYYSYDAVGLKCSSYICSANYLMDEKSYFNFQKFINENSNLALDCDMELNIFFNLLDALHAGVEDHIAASLMATDINREIAYGRIKPESTAFIHYLVMNFAPGTFINKGYVATNHSSSEKIDVKSLNLSDMGKNNE